MDQQIKQQTPAVQPSNHLAFAIVSTLLFCWPFGIPAIVNASKVNRLWNQGQYNEAYAASARAKKWCITSLILGIVFWVIYIIYIAVIVGAATTALYY
ncbi:MAG: CD225/dispanin family protein [Alistipes sp.]|nr:CD225/dispanin family protein [Alistipes sp.]